MLSLSLHHPIVLLALLSAAGIRNSKRLSSITVTLLDLLLQFCRAVKSGHLDMIKYHVTSLVVDKDVWGKIVFICFEQILVLSSVINLNYYIKSAFMHCCLVSHLICVGLCHDHKKMFNV